MMTGARDARERDARGEATAAGGATRPAARGPDEFAMTFAARGLPPARSALCSTLGQAEHA